MRLAPNRRVPTMSWRLWSVLAIALSVTGYSVTGAEVGKVKKSQPDEPRKVGSGLSFIGQTKVELLPVPAAAPGWFSETAASGLGSRYLLASSRLNSA